MNGNPAGGVALTWTPGPGLVLASSQAATGQDGGAVATVNLGPVAPGSVQTVAGCAWQTNCATWSLYGVDPSQLQVQITSGAGQSLPASATLGALTLLVTDGSGHPVQDASVSIYQRVLGAELPCNSPGRCPAAPVLAHNQTSMSSGADGSVSLQPLQVPGVAQTVEVAIAFGTQGLLTLTLVKTP